MNKKILISGFGPFANYAENPSRELVNSLSEEECEKFSIDRIILDCSWGRAAKSLIHKFKQGNYQYAISFGLATGRDEINIETKYFNLDDCKIADVDDEIRLKSPIINGASEIYESALAKTIYNKFYSIILCS